MKFKWLKKVGAVILAAAVVFGTQTLVPVSAAEQIEIVLTDVTQDDQTTLLGEAKIKVSVKGAGGSVTAVQTALKFEGKLKYKSIDFMQGSNNPPLCALIPPNAALANATRSILPSIVTNNSGKLTFTDAETDLFIITFAGEPGDSVTLSLDNGSAVKSYVTIGGKDFTTENGATESETATASREDNVGVTASVKLTMDKVTIMAADENGYADSKIVLTITNERTGSTISTVLNNIPISRGGHYDSTSTIPTFVVENTVVEGATYTVSLRGSGYKTFTRTGVTFEEPIALTNADFAPGDVNMDGKIDSADKTIFDGLLSSGEYNDCADFDRDGRITSYDNVFEGIEADTKTVPAKMSAPTVAGGEKKITVSWSAPDNGGSAITGYTIQYGTSSSNLDKTENIADASATSKEITGLSEDTTYYVKIAAKNDIGSGEFSAIANAKTNAAVVEDDEDDDDDDRGSGGGGLGGGGGGGGLGGGGAVGGGSATTTPVNPNEPFTDLGNYGWAKDSIYALKNKGIISGVSETQFAPANNIKRGDFILILTRMLSINEAFTENFADVQQAAYYYNAIGSAKAAGIAQGSGDYFMPENTITRQDLITLAYRAFLAKGVIAETDDFSALDAFADKGNIAGYAQAPMASMVKAGIIKGSDGMVNPLGNATRAEVAVMCARLVALMN